MGIDLSSGEVRMIRPTANTYRVGWLATMQDDRRGPLYGAPPAASSGAIERAAELEASRVTMRVLAEQSNEWLSEPELRERLHYSKSTVYPTA
jgi:hypothetical protein